jgi:hypothetical protein
MLFRYSVGAILELLLERCSDSADPLDDLLLVQDVAALLYVPATRCFSLKSYLHRKTGRDGDLGSCLQKFGLTQPEIEPISPNQKALFSFTQALLRRRFD